MQKKWLTRDNNDRLILFFNGWGMDERVVQHLNSGDKDVLMFYDYRDLTSEKISELDCYKEITVIAWSMGVWAASVILSHWNLAPSFAIALNGTEQAIDDEMGIPSKGYQLTEDRMDERGRAKFFSRIFSGRSDFNDNIPQRKLEEQKEELKCIRLQAEQHKAQFKWNRAYISKADVIFPTQNQENSWLDKTDIHFLEGGHYPFCHFKSWNSIISNECI